MASSFCVVGRSPYWLSSTAAQSGCPRSLALGDLGARAASTSDGDLKTAADDSLSPMAFDRASDNLSRLYNEKTDDELLQLYTNRDDLTELAQNALTKVMQGRNLEAPAETLAPPTGAHTEEPESDELQPDEIGLWSFDDMFQAQTAIQLLDLEQLGYRIIHHTRQSLAMGGRTYLNLVVKEEDYAAACKLLREKMGLFPAPEVEAPDSIASPLDNLIGIYLFDSETEMTEGLAVAQALGKAGVSFLWHDGRDSPEGLAEAMTISIEVRQPNAERAAAVVEACLATL